MSPARIGTQHKPQTNRRPGKLPGRRIAFVAASTLAGIACGSGALWPQAIALADTSPTIVQATVYEAGGGTLETSVSLAALEDNQTCPISSMAGQTIQENGRQGLVPVDLPPATWTLGTVLPCMDPTIDPSAVTSIDVTGSDGTIEDSNQYSTVTGAELANASLSPLVSYGGSDGNGVNNVEYNRPAHDASDLDFLDQVHSQSQPIQLYVYEGPSLNVTATASPSGEVTAGTTVTFNASVSPDDGANDPTYQWTFGDAASPTTATGATPTTTYTTAGLWNALVRVTDDKGASGTALVPIQVGSVPTSTNPAQTGTTPPATSSTPSTPTPVTPPGPTKTPHKAPTNGSRKPGAPKKQPSSRSGGGSGGGKTPTKTKQTQTQTQSSTTTSPTTASPTVPPQAGGGSGTGDGSGTTGGSGAGDGAPAGQQTATTAGPTTSLHPTTTPLQPPPTRTQHDRSPTPTGGRRVVGYTLSSVQTVPPGSSPLVTGAPVADRSPTANRHADAGASPLAIVLSSLVVLLLLCLGASRELRQSIDWHTLLARLRRD